MTTNSKIVELRNVEYSYPSAGNFPPALKKISLIVNAGDVVRVTGRNGTGKTTLLKVLTGKLSPTSGVRREKKGLRSVYLDQNAPEFIAEALTVREQMVVGLGTKIRAFESSRKGSLKETILKTLSRYGVGLEDKLDTFTSELSGGQRQIIALLSVLLAGAELIVLDEFTAALDPISIEVSNKLIKQAVGEPSVAVVFVNHAYESDLVINKEIRLE